MKVDSCKMTSTFLPVVVCLFVLSQPIYDNTFKHFQWRKDILRRDPKPWIRYIDKLLGVKTKKSLKFCSVEILQNVYSFVKIFVHTKTKSTHLLY